MLFLRSLFRQICSLRRFWPFIFFTIQLCNYFARNLSLLFCDDICNFYLCFSCWSKWVEPAFNPRIRWPGVRVARHRAFVVYRHSSFWSPNTVGLSVYPLALCSRLLISKNVYMFTLLYIDNFSYCIEQVNDIEVKLSLLSVVRNSVETFWLLFRTVLSSIRCFWGIASVLSVNCFTPTAYSILWIIRLSMEIITEAQVKNYRVTTAYKIVMLGKRICAALQTNMSHN